MLLTREHAPLALFLPERRQGQACDGIADDELQETGSLASQSLCVL